MHDVYLNKFETKQIPQVKNQEQTDILNNISKIENLHLKVSLRIGSKKMLLKDVTNMDIGTIIELNKLAKSPLEVFIDTTLIAYGSMVTIDGNFGIQIESLVTDKTNSENIL